jgi:hypothetical protein
MTIVVMNARYFRHRYTVMIFLSCVAHLLAPNTRVLSLIVALEKHLTWLYDSTIDNICDFYGLNCAKSS